MRRSALAGATAAIVVILVAGVVLLRNDEEPPEVRATPTATASLSPSPTAEPTPTPTMTPAVSPTEAPTDPPPAPTPAPTVAPTPATKVDVMVINDYKDPVDVELNDVVRKNVMPGEHIAVQVTPRADNNDIVKVRETVRGCGEADSQNYFDLGSAYEAVAFNGVNTCIEGGTRYSSPSLDIKRI